MKNPNTNIVIDQYKPGEDKAIRIQGKVNIIEKGEGFDSIYQLFFKKFKGVQEDPWKEIETLFLKIILTNKTSRGIN